MLFEGWLHKLLPYSLEEGQNLKNQQNLGKTNEKQEKRWHNQKTLFPDSLEKGGSRHESLNIVFFCEVGEVGCTQRVSHLLRPSSLPCLCALFCEWPCVESASRREVHCVYGRGGGAGSDRTQGPPATCQPNSFTFLGAYVFAHPCAQKSQMTSSIQVECGLIFRARNTFQNLFRCL